MPKNVLIFVFLMLNVTSVKKMLKDKTVFTHVFVSYEFRFSDT
jgi:hypothetical protein